MAWRVKLVFSDEEVESDDVFETEEAAYDGGVDMRSNYNTGMEVLHMSNPGDYPLEDEDIEIVTWEEDD